MDQDTALTVACLRCRKQKLRCTRERPVCRRCQRVRAECSYPPPPDRKRLALTRAQGHGNDLEAGPQDVAAAAAAAAPALGHSAVAVRPRTQPDMTPPSPPRNLHLSQINVSREVASFLFEIYFERHYQAELLFSKDDLLRDYNAGHLPEHVILAIFAFAAIFLPSAPGGIVQGTIDISDISRAEWSAIGCLWADSAGQQALMNADKPSLHLVQACQVLCLVWFARAQSGRTNMNTTIAYRASQLLQFDQARASAMTDWSRHRELGVRCFWSCWLTRCASQENARFEIDCWYDVAGLPLPLDPGHSHNPAGGPRPSVDKNGRLNSTQAAQKDQPLGFYSCLVIVQGLWWEILQLSRTMRTNQGSPSQWASTFSTLGKKIEDLESSVPAYNVQSPNVEVGQGRLFSLNYLYHMCIIHLYSSVVPLLSCSPHVPDMSQSLQRFAADKAWEQSKIMTTITDQFLSNKAAVSTLWPIVGYGAYVCAATQMRRLLALKCLTPQRLGRIKIHLSVTGELKKYWRTLEPLHQDMERQFSLAQTFTSTQSKEAQAASDAALSRLVTSQNAGVSPEFSHSLRVYVQNDDSPNADEDTGTSNHSTTDRAHSAKPEMSVPSEGHQSQTTVVGMDDIEHGHAGSEHSAPPPVMDFLEDGLSPMNAEAMWWNPDMTSLTEIFGMGIYPQDDYDYNII